MLEFDITFPSCIINDKSSYFKGEQYQLFLLHMFGGVHAFHLKNSLHRFGGVHAFHLKNSSSQFGDVHKFHLNIKQKLCTAVFGYITLVFTSLFLSFFKFYFIF